MAKPCEVDCEVPYADDPDTPDDSDTDVACDVAVDAAPEIPFDTFAPNMSCDEPVKPGTPAFNPDVEPAELPIP